MTIISTFSLSVVSEVNKNFLFLAQNTFEILYAIWRCVKEKTLQNLCDKTGLGLSIANGPK